MTTPSYRPSVIYAAIAGLCLFVISIGLNRFAYTAIIPCLINHHWTTTGHSLT
ncbi:MAG: site-specific recombinase [Gammaproteobacteria bacterium]|nr:site-specific recombinase [Gammaproteobacteria bacterium]